MQLLDDLIADHVLIERVIGSLQAFAAACAGGSAEAAAGAGYVRFFRDFAGAHHHAREEAVLFPALVDKAELPAARGPLGALCADHRELEGLLAQLAPLLTGAASDPARLQALAREHGSALLHHIDAENHVLFPEALARLKRAGVHELPGAPPDAAQQAARDEGLSLAERFPPREIEGVIRSEGCITCPSYGVRCDGIEREWWSDLEWEDAYDRMGST